MGAGKAGSVIHVENSYASGQIKRPRGPRSFSPVDLRSNKDDVLLGPLINLKDQAIAYYIHHHFQIPHKVTNVTKGISDDFLPVWIFKADCTILNLAVSSMALAVFSHTKQHPQAAIQASMEYNHLLHITQNQIVSLEKESIDVWLLATHFMSRYEQATYRPDAFNPKASFGVRLRSFLHHDGALAILKFWKDHLSQQQPVTDVIKHTRRSMIRSALIRNTALPKWIIDGVSFGEHGLELEYDCIIIRIISIRQKLFTLHLERNDIHSVSDEFFSAVQKLNDEARDVDKALRDWTAHFPGTWCYQRHNLPNSHLLDNRYFYSSTVFSFSYSTYAAVWGQYFAASLLINSTRLKILDLNGLNSDNFVDEQRLGCLSRIEIMGNDLASTVPYCLQRFEVVDNLNSPPLHSITLNTKDDVKPYVASTIAWPLSIASSIDNVDIKQRLWFQSGLGHIGRMIGDRVLQSAETHRWVEL